MSRIVAFIRRHLPKVSRYPLMIQWGRVRSVRPGIKGHETWADEADLVEYINYQFWIRLSPNPGVNLRFFGYWSRAGGKRRRVRV